jgi:16S rRNA (cytosine1402-N4)-methyltransferase
MVDRVSELLSPAVVDADSVLVDATVGLGGHSRVLLEQHQNLRLVGIDRDESALAIAGERLAAFIDRVTLVHAVYDEIPDVLAWLGYERVRGVLMDLGVSSLQLDSEDRGFAYAYDAPLDMRMDTSTGITAAEVLNTYSVEDLTRVLRGYGEERFAWRIAKAVDRERAKEPFATSARLVAVVREAIPAPAQRTGGHPAKRTFQALRIEVNGELAALERALPAVVDALAIGGRLVVLSYQSLEDRIVKRVLTTRTVDDVPADFPVAGRGPELRLLTRGAERPTDAEVERNPRATAARLRAAQRLREAA